MIYLFHGQDTFEVHRSLEAIRQRLETPDGLLASNTVVLDGAKLEPLELMQHATTIPFLAPARLVVVDGLLAAIGSTRGRRKKDSADPLAQWAAVADQLADPGALPETTTLVFTEGEVAAKNQAFTLFAPIAQTKDHRAIKGKELAAWVRAELKVMDLSLSEKAIRTIVEAVGSDLWAMHNELRKIQAYAGGNEVDDRAVSEIVGEARQSKIWDLTDAVVAGDERVAMSGLQRLLTSGEAAPMLAAMIARQFRQMVIARDLSDQRASRSEIARSAGVPDFKVDAVVALGRGYSWANLRRAYGLLVAADLSVKRGLQDDESSLQLLVHELCVLAPAGNTAPKPARAR